MINADDLQFFLEVARTGRLVTAAKALGVDHTTVGRRVGQLERTSGARLFDRAASGWTLTEAGDRLLVHAEAVESSLLAATEELGTTAGRLSGTLRIAAPDGFGAFVIAPGISGLRTKYPDLKIEIVTATRLNLLATKEFDIGVALEEPSTRGVQATKLATYPLALYASERYLEQNRHISSPGDLHQHALIGYVDSLLDIPSLRFLESSLSEMKPAIQTNNITGQWMAAVAGLGVAVLPMYIAEPDKRLVRVLHGVTIHRTYWMAIPRDLQRLARTKAAQAALLSMVCLHPFLTAPPI
ncbi:UNVERIFIED_ORG: DNA-binding transcriptional LysR family regulator [Arthrobacter sp. UYEF10]